MSPNRIKITHQVACYFYYSRPEFAVVALTPATCHMVNVPHDLPDGKRFIVELEPPSGQKLYRCAQWGVWTIKPERWSVPERSLLVHKHEFVSMWLSPK